MSVDEKANVIRAFEELGYQKRGKNLVKRKIKHE